MFINCPNCSALVATDLATGQPPERCPRCGFVPLAGSGKPSPAATAAAAGHVPGSLPGPAADPDPNTPADPVPTGSMPAPPRAGPRFLHRRQAGSARPGWRETAIAAGLVALLTVQLLLADRVRLAADAGWRPVVATLCGVLRCSLPEWREPEAIAIEQRDVRPAPERPGVLRVSALIRNDAAWPQAWPLLTLTLSDVDGRALGVRAFTPDEYLASPPRQRTLASGDSAAVRMDIVEPSPQAVAFNFRFD